MPSRWVCLPLLASRLCVSPWFRDTTDWRQWIGPSLPIWLLVIGLPVTTATYRVLEVPYRVPPWEDLSVLTPVELESQASLRRVLAGLPRISFRAEPDQWDVFADPEFHGAPLVEQLVELTSRDTLLQGSFHDTNPVSNGVMNLLVAAHGAESQGEIQAAWRYYLAALRLAQLQRGRLAGRLEVLQAFELEKKVLQRLPYWAMQDDTSPSQIEAAIQELLEYRQEKVDPQQVLAVEYHKAKAILDDPKQRQELLHSSSISLADPNRLVGRVQSREMVYSNSIRVWMGRFAAWEWRRAHRLCDYLFDEGAKLTRNPSLTKKLNATTLLQGAGWGSNVAYTLPPAQRQADFVRVGTIYQLKTMAFLKENGHYPPSFTDMQLPDDPYHPGKSMRIDKDGLATRLPEVAGLAIVGVEDGAKFSDGAEQSRLFLLPKPGSFVRSRFDLRLQETTQERYLVHVNDSTDVVYGQTEEAEGLFDEPSQPEAFGRISVSVDEGRLDMAIDLRRSAALAPKVEELVQEALRLGDEQILLSLERNPQTARALMPLLLNDLAKFPTLTAQRITVLIYALIRAQPLSDQEWQSVGEYFSTSSEEGRPRRIPILNHANGHYYEVVDEILTWDESLAAASRRTFQGIPGHLATITTPAEYRFLTQAMPPRGHWYWVGGARANEDGKWRWVAGAEQGQLFHDPDAGVPFADFRGDGTFGQQATGLRRADEERPSESSEDSVEGDCLSVQLGNGATFRLTNGKWDAVDWRDFVALPRYIVEYDPSLRPEDDEHSPEISAPQHEPPNASSTTTE